MRRGGEDIGQILALDPVAALVGGRSRTDWWRPGLAQPGLPGSDRALDFPGQST
ncbi:MAG TPA: hypothetical protein VMU90_13135 [Solirubrobacteraceae bacterium]|nr:hypothetical protein [Solirubrobacteraceae bacterium]